LVTFCFDNHFLIFFALTIKQIDLKKIIAKVLKGGSHDLMVVAHQFLAKALVWCNQEKKDLNEGKPIDPQLH